MRQRYSKMYTFGGSKSSWQLGACGDEPAGRTSWVGAPWMRTVLACAGEMAGALVLALLTISSKPSVQNHVGFVNEAFAASLHDQAGRA